MSVVASRIALSGHLDFGVSSHWLMLCCSVLVIPVLLLLGGALFALPSLATAILPVSIVHFLTILIMIALGILSAILVTILSAGVSFSIDFFSSGIRNFVKTKIFRSSSEDNSFSREKILKLDLVKECQRYQLLA